jgi:hypothetical protein
MSMHGRGTTRTENRRLQMSFIILMLLGLSACEGYGGALSASNSTSRPRPAAPAGVSSRLASASVRATAQPGYGPRIAVGPQASITCAPNSVNLSPRQNIQTVVSTHAAGTVYCLSAGTYSQQTITPHSGDTFVGVQGAILNGRDISQYAFSNYYAGASITNVTIENLLIENYDSPVQTAAIFGDGSGNTGWNILNNEIASNGALGVYAQSGWNIIGNYIHNNLQGGYFASGVGITITDNEISYNDPTDAFDFNANGCGGGKTFESANVNVSYNYSHNNVGPGLWTDTDNQGTTYSYNDVENNSRNGIMHEISWDAVIQNNFLRGDGTAAYCGLGTGANLYCSEIFISNSGGELGMTVDISSNTISMSSYGGAIGLLNVYRGNGLYGPWLVQNVQVHNNTVQLKANAASPGGTFGAVDHDGTDPAMFTSQGNSFDSDSFTGALRNSFYWGPGNVYGNATSFSGFQSDAQEIHGTSR